MSAVESALDVLSRAATMVQGQFGGCQCCVPPVECSLRLLRMFACSLWFRAEVVPTGRMVMEVIVGVARGEHQISLALLDVVSATPLRHDFSCSVMRIPADVCFREQGGLITVRRTD